jgi:serine/threonine protein kinase
MSSSPPSPSESDWPSELGCYVVERPVTSRAARGRDLRGRPVWLHWSPCEPDADELCGAEREYLSLSVNPARAVPEVRDLVRVAGRCWTVTEVIDGLSLAQVVAEGQTIDVSRVAADVLAALRRAHAAGWVHGDVKPANVMLRPDGHAVLVDWELAARVGRPAFPGSLGYAPPHAWEGGYHAETRNDTYALAVLLAELRDGERLFDGDRSTVTEAQRAYAFASRRDADELVAAVFAAADAGVGTEAVDLPLDASLLDMRMDHVLRLSVRGAASSIVAAVRRGDIARARWRRTRWCSTPRSSRSRVAGASTSSAGMRTQRVGTSPGGSRCVATGVSSSPGASLVPSAGRRPRSSRARLRPMAWVPGS